MTEFLLLCVICPFKLALLGHFKTRGLLPHYFLLVSPISEHELKPKDTLTEHVHFAVFIKSFKIIFISLSVNEGTTDLA